jgi:protein-tyrosine-phosphatase
MAARLLCDLVTQNDDLSAWRIESAGTWGIEGAALASRANQAMKQLGLELDGHRSRCVNGAMLQDFRLILTMEKGQQEALRIEFPALRSRVYCLSELIGQRWDLLDPPSGDLADYIDVAEQIRGVLEKGFDQIKRLAREEESGVSADE